MSAVLTLVTALATGLCVAGGYEIGQGAPVLGYGLAVLGAGWLGVLYGHLIQQEERSHD